MQLHSTSLYSVGVQGAKDIIDLCISNNATVIFYDHNPAGGGTPSLTEAQLEDVLDYAVASGIYIGNPSDVIDKIHSRTIKGFNTKRTSYEAKANRSLVKENLLFDSNFIEIRDNPSSPCDWYFGASSLLTGGASFGSTNRINYREAVLRLDDQNTTGDGSASLVNTSTEFNSEDICSPITFSPPRS